MLLTSSRLQENDEELPWASSRNLSLEHNGRQMAIALLLATNTVHHAAPLAWGIVHHSSRMLQCYHWNCKRLVQSAIVSIFVLRPFETVKCNRIETTLSAKWPEEELGPALSWHTEI